MSKRKSRLQRPGRVVLQFKALSAQNLERSVDAMKSSVDTEQRFDDQRAD